jgi:hypothetical protein
MTNDEPLRSRLTAVLGISLDSPDAAIVDQVGDLCALRQRVQADTAREQRIAGLQRLTNCTRESALAILQAQGRL